MKLVLASAARAPVVGGDSGAARIGSHAPGSVGASGEENRIRSAEFERQFVIQPVLLDAPIEMSDAVTHDHTPSQWLQFCDHPTGKASGHPGPVDFVTHGRQITEYPLVS
ncbi:hypothetical protein [Nocardia sp. NPDC004604]|uniref:hypothetical protein n=1 Tax=Nocardia sp. NPDC004604 TaxID=3157013 RepID=UPI0033B5D10B